MPAYGLFSFLLLTGENTDQPTTKKTEDSFCFCCVKSANDIVRECFFDFISFFPPSFRLEIRFGDLFKQCTCTERNN